MSQDETAPPAAAPTERMIPYDRFQKVNEAKNQYEAELSELRPQVETLRAAAAELETVRSRIEQLQAERDMAANAVTLARVHPALIDEEAQGIAQSYYSRLPAESRPPIADWLKSSIESGSVPKGLQAWFSDHSQPQRVVAQPQAPVSASQPGPNPVVVTKTDIEKMIKENPAKAIELLRSLQKK